MTAEEFWQHYQAGESDFRGVKLRGIVLHNVRLGGLDLSCADLRGASLMGVDLSGANLSRADLSHTFLILSQLTNSNLTQANLTGAFLVRADLQGCRLHQANFTRANLTKANLLGTTEGSTAVFTDAILTGTRLPQPLKSELRSMQLKLWLSQGLQPGRNRFNQPQRTPLCSSFDSPRPPGTPPRERTALS